MSNLAEADIIQRCLSGHPDAFGLLYDAYVRKIFTFIYYRTHQRETAEDLTSLTFLKALRSLHQFDAKVGSFSSWLYRIARNAVTDHYRTNHVNRDIADVWDLADSTDLVGEVHTRTQLERVRGMLHQLTPQQREVVLLRAWEGLSFREIAEITGGTEASCKMSYSRSLRTLRAQLPLAMLLLAAWVLHP